MHLPLRPLATLATGLALVLGAVACGGSSADTAATSSTTSGSDYTIVPDAEVSAGLAEVRALAQGLAVARATSEERGRDDVERMYTKWYTFEGTVREKDQDLYLWMEDGLGGMKIGVQEDEPNRIASGLADFETAADKYLAAHPG